jgi:Copper transport outer membrane protein, MctB
MINLRFHMVSLVAVFFALAIGIAIGATVVDQGVLTQTERRLSSFDAKLQQRDRSLSALRKQLRAEKALIDQLGPKANTDRLAGRTFVVVAVSDVSIESIRAVSRTLSSAGAEVVGTFRLDRTLGLSSKREQRDARALLNVPEVSGKGGLAGLRSAMVF